MKNKIKINLLIRYIFCYAIVLFIPILLISIIIYSDVFSKTESNIIESDRNVAQNTLHQFERTLNELNTMAYKIIDDSDLSFNSQNDAIKIMNGVKLLAKYRSISEIEKICLYYSHHNKFYTDTGTYSFDIFYDYLNLDNHKKEEFKKLLTTSNKYVLNSISSLSTPENATNVSNLLYIVPNPYHLSTKKNSVCFLLDPTVMKSNMNAVEGISLLLDGNGEILLTNLDTKIDMATIQNKIDNPINNNNNESIILEDIEYYMITLPSDYFRLSYVVLIPIDYMLSELNGIKTMYLYSVLLLLFVSSAVIVLISKAQYNPIKNLIRYANAKAGKIGNMGKNELDSVRLAIEEINTHKEQLDAELLRSKPALKEYDIDNLITGQYKSVEEFNEHCNNNGITLEHKQFCIGRYRLTYSTESIPLSIQNIIEYIEKQSNKKVQFWGRRGMKSKIFTMLICTDCEKDKVLSYLTSINNSISEQYSILCAVGLGNIYESVQFIGKSYLEADLALSYRLVSGNNKIILIDKVMNNEVYKIQYPSNRLHALEYAITDGNVTAIVDELASICSIIRSDSMPLFTARCISYDIINTVMRTMSAIHKKFLVPKRQYPDVMSLAQYESLDDLENIVKAVCLDICDFIVKNKDTHSQGFIHNIMDYINKNGFNHNFSLLKMSEELNVSQSLISHQFKKQTNQTVGNYVNNLRIEKAKKLLVNDNLTVAEIINQVGYYDVSSFTRKFKMLVGTTPGAFRKQFTKT